jgi:hypothetical protein
MLLLVVVLTIVIPLDVVVLVEGVKILPLGAVSDELSGVAALEATPR